MSNAVKMTTREEAFAAVAALNEKIATLSCAEMINGAAYGHEIDPGFGKLETALDAIKPIARMIHFMRHEARAVSIPEGGYDWAKMLCDRAETLVGMVKLIEGRAAR